MASGGGVGRRAAGAARGEGVPHCNPTGAASSCCPLYSPSHLQKLKDTNNVLTLGKYHV